MLAAVDDVLANLTEPPGRRPAQELIELNKWYLTLSAPDRQALRRALAEASHAAVFGLLAVLDGVRTIDEAQPPGTLELWHNNQGSRTLLNGDLHDLLNSKPWHR